MAEGTRERILDTAERLFADRGISGTSLRVLTQAAGVNLAAVHYHFGSKEGLLDAVVERRAAPANRERLAELASLEAAGALEAAAGAPAIEDILRAFLEPALRALPEEPAATQQLTRLLARIEAQSPDVVEAIYRKHFGHVLAQFLEALQRVLPEVSKEQVADRFRCAVGTLSFVFSANYDLNTIPGHPQLPRRMEEKADLAISFIAAGLRAPNPRTPRLCLHETHRRSPGPYEDSRA